MQRELHQFSRTRELPASHLRRSVYLFRRDLRARVEPDGSSSWLHSAAAKKLIFGREATEVFRIQSGVKIPVKPQEIAVKATPSSVSYTHRGPEKVQAAHSVRLVEGECRGWARTVRLTNKGDAAKVRVLALHDPTSLNFRRDRDPPGEIGVNAFNRHDQVVMDDVGDTAGVRVIGFFPRPSAIYMTKDRGRAIELLSLGELPESSLGMSGSVIMLTQHDLDLSPGSTTEVGSVSVYHPSSLEAALNAASARPGEPDSDLGVEFASSSPSMNFAFDWAKAALFAAEGEPSLAERLWSGTALSLVRGAYFEGLAESVKRGLRKDGTLGYEGTPERPGPVETSLYLVALCSHVIARSRDKKLVKKWYPHVRKVADGLAGMLSDGLVKTPADSPDGWRRRLGAGYPTGWTAEVNLLALRALRDASAVASLAEKGGDSARFGELSARLLTSLNQRLRDSETGFLSLNVDPRGVAHKEITIDQAVGLSYATPDLNLSSSVLHRLLESDFETGYGPRTVPSSNNLYFSPSYGEGQLGGYWTRAAVAHAMLAFASGYPSIGSAQLEKVARLVHLEAERLGGIPGEFPRWIDTERRQAVGSGSDLPAAARFIEATIVGEGGLSLGSQGPRFRVPEASNLRWAFLHGLGLGKGGSIFIGRSAGRAYAFTTLEQEAFEGQNTGGQSGTAVSRLPDAERIGGQGGVEGLLLWDSVSSMICLGNGGTAPFSGSLPVPSRSKSFSTTLFAQMDELQQDTGLWSPVERVKLRGSMELKVELRPGAWTALRLSKV